MTHTNPSSRRVDLSSEAVVAAYINEISRRPADGHRALVRRSSVRPASGISRLRQTCRSSNGQA